MYSAAPVPITPRLRRAQGASYYTLHLVHRIGRVEVYARHRRGQPLDFAVVYGSLVAHGPTGLLALAALRAVVRERRAIDAQTFDWQAGLDNGFTADCLARFCAANDLRPDQRITLGELRRTVTKNRAVNAAEFVRQLNQIGIHVSPPKK